MFKNMFVNIDEKIKKISKIAFYVACGFIIIFELISMIVGMVDANNFGDGLLAFILAIFECAGLLFTAYVSSLLIYGFGQIIENTSKDKKVEEEKPIDQE